jgi:cation diffusion facilitator CzcD-associated flavoprotein CzcO
VVKVGSCPRGLLITPSNEGQLTSDRVVVATGLSGFAHLPDVLASLNPEIALHPSKVTAFSNYTDRSVAVIRGGHSALDVDRTPLAVPVALTRTSRAAPDDAVWRRRGVRRWVVIHEVPGNHDTLWDAENIDVVRRAVTNVVQSWVVHCR